LALSLSVLAACHGEPAPAAESAGNADRGRLLLRQFGCGNCRAIPGVAAARGNVGPPLDQLARRAYLAGTLANTPDNLTRWIRAPQQVKPGTAMPDMQVGDAHARDMVAYLYTLE
jgi:cytochrome c2